MTEIIFGIWDVRKRRIDRFGLGYAWPIFLGGRGLGVKGGGGLKIKIKLHQILYKSWVDVGKFWKMLESIVSWLRMKLYKILEGMTRTSTASNISSTIWLSHDQLLAIFCGKSCSQMLTTFIISNLSQRWSGGW